MGSFEKMTKKTSIFVISLIFVVLASTCLVFSNDIGSASTPSAAKLAVTIAPTSVPADNSTYNCVYVQLQDANGQPVRALQDTTINLASSLTNIGTVDPSIIIPLNQTYASANFYSTFTPGTTTISVSANGFANVQAVVTTIAPIPSAIAVYGFPSTLPADGNQYPAIMVQLQDPNGYPARAPQAGVQVQLSCSDTIDVGNVSSSVTIPAGQTYAIANITTTTQAETVGQLESAAVTAVSQGYMSGEATITTTPIAFNPTKLEIFAGPSQFPSDNNTYSEIAVELQNDTGYAAVAPSDQSITLSSSDQTVAQINSTITISQAQTYALATFSTTFKAGTTTLTAAANNLQTNYQSVRTFGFTPSKLALFCVPSTLPADKSTYDAVVVQLQDSSGRPAIDPTGDVIVRLFSSQPTVATVNSTLTIPFGQTQAAGGLTVTNSPGSAMITGQTSNYATGQATITSYLIDYSPLQMSLSANPQSVYAGNSTTITALLTSGGTPVTGATVTFASNNGGTFTSTVEEGNGYYNTSFTASVSCTITATASKLGYQNNQTTLQITVLPTPTPSPTSVPTASPTPIPTPTPAPVSMGSIQFLIVNSDQAPLNNVLVTSTSQPTNVNTLLDFTNSTGYVTFADLAPGSYSFNIAQNGYASQNETLTVNTQPISLTIILNSKTSAALNANSGDTIPIVIVIVVVALALSLVSGLYMISLRRSSKIRKLQDLQQEFQDK